MPGSTILDTLLPTIRAGDEESGVGSGISVCDDDSMKDTVATGVGLGTTVEVSTGPMTSAVVLI